MTVKILFVCKYNRFRSKVAEAYFKKVNRNKNIKIESAGIIKGNPISKFEKSISKEFGINIGGTPRTLSSKLLSKTDIIIIVADDVQKEIFRYNGKYIQKVLVWKIKDNLNDKSKEVEKIIKQIMKKVDDFVIEVK